MRSSNSWREVGSLAAQQAENALHTTRRTSSLFLFLTDLNPLCALVCLSQEPDDEVPI